MLRKNTNIKGLLICLIFEKRGTELVLKLLLIVTLKYLFIKQLDLIIICVSDDWENSSKF